uniref:DUF3363 domain-containing protein n=2 Tax=Bradyrhizobium sp. DOA9 TaxID=1126627 RepID=UPI0030EEB269
MKRVCNRRRDRWPPPSSQTARHRCCRRWAAWWYRRASALRGRHRPGARTALAIRSELMLDKQIVAEGATWLDRQLGAREPAELSRAGFGAEVRIALEQRIDVLTAKGLAQRDVNKVRLGRNLMETLRNRELDLVGRRLAEETGLSQKPAESGEQVSGIYRRRLSPASGRFAMIDNGLGFELVPWIPSLEHELGRQVSSIAGSGSVDWSFGRKRGLSR